MKISLHLAFSILLFISISYIFVCSNDFILWYVRCSATSNCGWMCRVWKKFRSSSGWGSGSGVCSFHWSCAWNKCFGWFWEIVHYYCCVLFLIPSSECLPMMCSTGFQFSSASFLGSPRAWPMLRLADCSDGRLSRLLEQPMLRPMLSVTDCLPNKPNVVIWLWTQLYQSCAITPTNYENGNRFYQLGPG